MGITASQIVHRIEKSGGKCYIPLRCRSHHVIAFQCLMIDIHDQGRFKIQQTTVEFKEKISNSQISSGVHGHFHPLIKAQIDQAHHVAGIAFFQIPVDLLNGIIHAAVIHTDDLIFFKILFHGPADSLQKLSDIFSIVVQIQHAGYEIFLFILYCFFLHNVSFFFAINLKTDPDHIRY